MNLLPKTEVDFARPEYWDKFFKKRGSKEFEWYGEYTELCKEFQKYLKKNDAILVVGCGNSMLSSDLYDTGYRQITNIDISPVVIKQMRNKVGRERQEMTFEEMDALNMTYEGEKFNVVLDKGTLDALMPNDTTTDKKRAQKLFSEVDRVLKICGRYIIISLLQRHILQEIFSYFMKGDWFVKIMRCWDVEKKKIMETGSLTMPVFMVVCFKMRKIPNPLSHPILEMNIYVHGKWERISSDEDVSTMIEGLQKTIMHCREAKGEVEIKFCRTYSDVPRYSIYIADVSRDQRKLLKFAAFIVPHGRETEWMFGTPEGRNYLRESSGFDRLVVVTFHRNQKYGSMEEIQDELRQTILQLAPPCIVSSSSTCSSPKVPYLTLGDGVGRRKTIYSGRSLYSGNLIVEEVEIEKETYRRLVFLNNQAVVQSEVKLTKGLTENKKKSVDSSHIASNHIIYMSIPAAMKTQPLSIAVLGLGGGGLCAFLHKVFPESLITGVEIDPLVVTLAKDYFGFETDDRLKVVVNDGLEFLKEKQKFDIIMFDVDSKERGSAISCPPAQFVESSTLENVAEVLGSSGIFVTNVVTRVKTEHDNLIKKIRKHFRLISWSDLKEDVNRIVFASNWRVTKEQWRQKITDAAVELEKISRNNLKKIDESLDLYQLINGLKI